MKITTIVPEGPIATILIDNASHKNALTLAMWRELAATCSRLAQSNSVRVVLLRGQGNEAFSTGADLTEFTALRHDLDGARAYNQAIQSGIQAVQDLPMPVIAQLNGMCVGGGVALALMADIRLMDDSGRFGIPAAKLGIAYHPTWIARLAQIIGVTAASNLLLTAGLFDATHASDWGFATETAPRQTLATTAHAYATRIAGLAPLSLRAVKAALRGTPATIPKHLQQLMQQCDASADYQKGVAGFLAGTRPEFEGN